VASRYLLVHVYHVARSLAHTLDMQYIWKKYGSHNVKWSALFEVAISIADSYNVTAIMAKMVEVRVAQAMVGN